MISLKLLSLVVGEELVVMYDKPLRGCISYYTVDDVESVTLHYDKLTRLIKEYLQAQDIAFDIKRRPKQISPVCVKTYGENSKYYCAPTELAAVIKALAHIVMINLDS